MFLRAHLCFSVTSMFLHHIYVSPSHLCFLHDCRPDRELKLSSERPQQRNSYSRWRSRWRTEVRVPWWAAEKCTHGLKVHVTLISTHIFLFVSVVICYIPFLLVPTFVCLFLLLFVNCMIIIDRSSYMHNQRVVLSIVAI